MHTEFLDVPNEHRHNEGIKKMVMNFGLSFEKRLFYVLEILTGIPSIEMP